MRPEASPASSFSAAIRYGVFVAALAAAFALVFVLVDAIGVTLLENPRPALSDTGSGAAVLGVALLVVDALLPIPSSLVMISLGALYGPVAGTLLSLAGRFGMAVVGFAVGRAGSPVLVKLIGPGRRAHADALIGRWGALAIIFSRPVPLLAETVIITAGASGLRWRVALLAAFVGSVPEAIAYGVVGDVAASAANGALVWIGFLVVGTLFRLLELGHRRRSRRRTAAAARSPSAAGT